MSNNLISHAATVIGVSNMPASLAYYTKSLGFELHFKWGEPITYATLKRATAQIHLTLVSKDQVQRINRPQAYIFVHDIDQIFTEFKAKGVIFGSDLEQREYKMKDFDIQDPDGNVLCFGMG